MSGPVGASQWMYSAGGFEIEQSLKFNDDESQYLSWTPASAGNRKTWTFSAWVKRGNLGGTQNLFMARTGGGVDYWYIDFSSDSIRCSGSLSSSAKVTTAVYRDVSAWYHIVCAVDTTQAVANDRVKIFVNGEQVTDFSSNVAPAQNGDTAVNSTVDHHFSYNNGSQFFDGYLADVYFIDGTALDPTSFGETVNGYWKPKEATGLTYGTNGFHLTFQDDVVSEGFNTVTYTGTGAAQSISGLGFNPDLLWIKRRDAVNSHILYDSVRGDWELSSNSTGADISSAGRIGSLDADGFTFENTSAGTLNASGGSYVAWCWDAGTGSPASNTDGSITSTVKANPSYGFSVVSWTGTGTTGQETIGVGLNWSGKDKLVITKNRDGSTYNWAVNSSVLAANKVLSLNTTNDDSQENSSHYITYETNGFRTYNGSNILNISGNKYIAYCFHSVSGYSKIGSYSGTDSAGVTVTTGFRPAFVMIKCTNLTENWVIIDNTRNPANPANSYLNPNTSSAEVSSSAFDIDFTDTGFVLQGTDDAINGYSGGTGEYIYAAFADTREYAFWKDVSGNGNNWTPNNLDYRDSLPDTPTNNFATLNPVIGSHGCTVKEGNLYATVPDNKSIGSTIAVDSGKWYVEFYANSSSYVSAGIVGDSQAFGANLNGSSVAYMYSYAGAVYKEGTGDFTPTTYTSGDVISFYIDLDNNKLYIYKNGAGITTSEGTHAVGSLGISITDRNYYFGTTSNGNNAEVTFNFGQDSTFAGAKAMGSYTDDNGIGNFQYAPPTGYLSLCTSNLTTPTIVDGSQHFNTVLYVGDYSTSNPITGVGFSPDFVWIKDRGLTTVYNYSHALFDTVRGAGKWISTNRTDAENDFGTGTTSPFRSFDADGFTVGQNYNTNEVDPVADYFVSWNWKAGGTAVSNTDGSITSQVSANTDMGFSIVSYTGTGNSSDTVGTGLSSSKPLAMAIVKRRDSTSEWQVGNIGYQGSNFAYHLELNSTAAGSGSAPYFMGSQDTSSGNLLYLASGALASGATYIAYCFQNSDIIKVGSYTGNGSTDGPFVWTGFRPSLVICKRTDSTSSWWMMDNKRDTYNVNDAYLVADTSGAEGTYTSMDFLSNGFKPRNSSSSFNTSGATHIFIAFAETPFKYANAR